MSPYRSAPQPPAAPAPRAHRFTTRVQAPLTELVLALGAFLVVVLVR
jgi:hypothetical protein